MVSLLSKSNVHQGEPVCNLKVRVPIYGIATFGVEASDIGIHLDLVHDVHMCLTRQAATGNLVEREVLVVAQGLVELGHRPVNATEFEEFPQLAVIHGHGVVGLLLVEVELRPHHNVIGAAHQGSLDFHHILHNLHGLVRYVVDEGDALRRHCDTVHRKAHEVADTGADAAVEDKDVLGHLQLRRHLSLQDRLEF